MKTFPVVLLLIVTCTLFISTGFCQDPKIDSLLKTLASQPEDTNKVKTYFEIIKIVRHYDYDTALHYAGLQLALSNKLNYAWGRGKAYNSMALVQRFKGNINASTDNFFKAANIFLSVKDYNNAITAYSNAADNFSMVNNADSAIIISKLAHSYNNNITDSALWKENSILFYSNLSGIYYIKKMPDSTIVYSDSAIILAKETGDLPRLADEYLQSGAAYQSIKNNTAALEHFRMALAIYEKLQGYLQMIQVHHAMGYSFYTIAQYDSTIHHAETALKLMAKVKDSTYLSSNCLNMGLAYAGLKNYEAAIGWYKKGIAAADSTNNPGLQLQLYQYSGEALYGMHQYQQAIISFKIALSKASSFDYKEIYECSDMLSACYEAIGDSKTALLFARKSANAWHLYFDSTQAQIVAEINLKNESQKKEDQIKLLSTQSQLNATLATAQSQQKKIAVTGICFLVVAGFYGFYRYKKKRQLQSQQAIANERLRISRELHDEVGSTLSGIAMYSHVTKRLLTQANETEVEKSLNIIQQSADEMVGKLNDIVWLINPEQDSLQMLIQRLEEYANDMAAIKGMKVTVTLPEKMQPVDLPIETRRSIYLFCKETINNSVKYSEGTKLELSVSATADNLTFSVADNGKGFNESTIKKGNGLNNMQKRADEIGAKFTLKSKLEKGSAVILQIKNT